MKLVSFMVAICLAAAGDCAASAQQCTANGAAVSVQADPAALSKVVFIGDSLTSGMQNNSLSVDTQVHGWPYLVAQQARFSIVEPWVAAPGIPNEMTLESSTFPYMFGTLPGQSTGRINTTRQATNIAVPGATIWSVLYDRPTSLAGNGQYGAVNLVLGYPAGSTMSQIERAVALQPSSVFIFVGGADVLPAVLYANPSFATELDTFADEYAYMLYQLKTQTNAHIFMATVPDPTLLPTVVPAPQLAQEVAAYSGQQASVVEADLGLQDSDSVNEGGIYQVEWDLMSNGKSAVLPVLPAQDIMTQSIILQIRTEVQNYNQDLTILAGLAGATLVDLNGLMNGLQDGQMIDGKELTLNFLGGFFSLDGLHLTNTGYALVANAFISAINSSLKMTVPPVDMNWVAAHDPLFTGPVSPESLTANTAVTGKATTSNSAFRMP